MNSRILALLIALILLPGCSLRLGSNDNALQLDGLASAYATASAWPEYDGTFFRLGLLGEDCEEDEVITLDVWPLFGVGVGIAGARVRVLPFEVAAGVLFYDPDPPGSRGPKTKSRGKVQRVKLEPKVTTHELVPPKTTEVDPDEEIPMDGPPSAEESSDDESVREASTEEDPAVGAASVEDDPPQG